MKVSIVTISYNQAKFLEKTILSVINQDYDNFEYIVVDPGSTDGSREIIEKYRSRIDHVIFEPDQGAADGLNKGFAVASGEIFGFLNSDDVLLPKALSSVVKFFNSYPDTDVVSGHAQIIDEDDNLIRNCYSDRFSLRACAYGTAIIMQQSTFFRSSYFKAINGFNVLNKASWDGELFVDLALQKAKFALADQFWSCYRLHSLSITSSKSLDIPLKAHYKNMFKKIMNRDSNILDIPIMGLFRVLRYVQNPRDFYERISNGPIYGRTGK